MSTALAVCHGSFGRIPVYRPDEPMGTHAHREGRLTFHLGAPPAIVTISNVLILSTKPRAWRSTCRWSIA